MGKNTSIEWTDHSWPIVNGCRRVSAGCENCYAERLTATRLVKTPKYGGLAVFGKNGPKWTGETRLWEPHLDMPLRLKKPSKIFVANMGDLFYEGVSDEDIARVFNVMAACPQHTFQVLTKRPERTLTWSGVVSFPGGIRWPLPNVWLGVSVEDQATADERIPLLLKAPAAVRFVSAEPLLGPVDLSRWMWPVHWAWGSQWKTPEEAIAAGGFAQQHRQALVSAYARFIDWVIVGGESGRRARPCAVEWIRRVVDQCREAGTPVFVKQLGARPYSSPRDPLGLSDRKGGDIEEWPEDLRVRQFPEGRTS